MCSEKTVLQFVFLISLAICVSTYPQRNRVKLHVPYKHRVVHKHHLKRIPVPVPLVKHIPIVKTVPVYKTVEVPVYQPVQVQVPVYVPQYHHQYTSPPVQHHNPWTGNKYTQWEDNTGWASAAWNDQSQTGYDHVYEPHQQTYEHSTPIHYPQEEFYPISSHQTDVHPVHPFTSQQTADIHYSEYPTFDQWKGLRSTEMRRMSNDNSEMFHPVETQSEDELPYTDYQIYEHSTDLPHAKVTNYHAHDTPKDHTTKLQIVDHPAENVHFNDLPGHRNPKVVMSKPREREIPEIHVNYIPKFQQGSQIFDQHIHDRDHKIFSNVDNVATQ